MVSLGFIGAAVAWLILGLIVWRVRGGVQRPTRAKITTVLLWLLVPLLLGSLVYAHRVRRELVAQRDARVRTDRERENLQVQLDEILKRDSVHYATLLNHGNPPIPRASPLPPSLSKTYYRGNDERSEELFNGGNFRTVTFELWLEDSEGSRVDVGSPIVPSDQDDDEPRPLFLVVRFIRSPDTSSGYFTRQYMSRMYLTLQKAVYNSDEPPVTGRVEWQMTEKDRVWVARYPLPPGVIFNDKSPQVNTPKWVRITDPKRPHDRGGIIYLCEDRYWHEEKIGGRFHYAVRYDLKTVDGRVSEGSDLWMQALYRGQNVADLQIGDEEWLSSQPIPEKR